MKIVVTGGAGFLGSHLCFKLVNSGNEVWCIDNLITGRMDNVSELMNKSGFHFVNANVAEKIPELPKIDQIYHLASPASPNINSKKSYHNLPFETMQANTTGTQNMAELAMTHKAKLLFASTSEVYGEPLEHPQTESYRGNVSTTGPRSVYDEAKRFGETIVAAYVRHKHMDGRVVRIFNTYGPRLAEDDGRVVSEFVYAARNNKPLKIFGDGLQTRSFCFVSDLIEGLVLAMNHENTKGEIFNLGNPDEFTVNELAKLVIRLTGSKSEIVISNVLPENDPIRRKPDITKAQKELGFCPKINLEDGLRKLIEYVGQPVPNTDKPI